MHLPKFYTVVTAPFATEYAEANKALVPVWILPIVTRKLNIVTATFLAGFALFHRFSSSVKMLTIIIMPHH